MKKPRFAVLTVIMALALVVAACGDDDAEETTTTAAAGGETTTTAAPAQEPFRIAIVAPSASNDLAFSQSIVDAVGVISDEMGNVEVQVTDGTFVVEDAAAAIRGYASDGVDLVIAHGSQYGGSLQEIAPDFPETSFAWGTAADTFGLPNVYSYEAASDEGGYVMGVMGGRRGKIHREIGQSLADLNHVVRPKVTVIDATRILLRHGPTGGNIEDVKVLDTLIASTDPVAADAYATTLFGLKPEEVSSTVAAHAMGLGQIDLAKVKVVEA